MSRTIESELSLLHARERILALAEPGEPIEVSLVEALGLVLAEPVVADGDQPPFDRAGHDGYAVRADEATVGALLRVVAPKRATRPGDSLIEAGEAARVKAGDPIPPGADTVIRPSTVRPDPETGPTRVIEVLRAARPGRDVTPRGANLTAGTTVAAAGRRLKPAMVPLLAAQGVVHPLCHRRVRVSILTVGSHWVRPDEAPTMKRERNAANLALVALAVRLDALPHDFQAVAGPMIHPALERAATNPVVLILGPPSRPLRQAWDAIGCETVVGGVAVAGIGRVRFGVLRDDDGQVTNYVFQLPAHPVTASVAFALLVEPLIARLQGDTADPTIQTLTLAGPDGQPKTGRRTRVAPATRRVEADGRVVAEPLNGPLDDLATWADADGSLVFPEHSGPWHPGDRVEFVPLARQESFVKN